MPDLRVIEDGEEVIYCDIDKDPDEFLADIREFMRSGPLRIRFCESLQRESPNDVTYYLRTRKG
jgi:hypothetical protein